MNDDMSDEEFDQFLMSVFQNYSNAMRDDSAIYVFHGSSYQREFENSMNAAGIFVRSQCIWVKIMLRLGGVNIDGNMSQFLRS